MHLSETIHTGDDTSIYNMGTKQEMYKEMTYSLKNFFYMLKSTGGGRMNLDDQVAVDAAISACTGENIRKKKLLSTLKRALGISNRLLHRGIKIRKEMEDRDEKHFVRIQIGEYSNSIKNGKFIIVFFFQCATAINLSI